MNELTNEQVSNYIKGFGIFFVSALLFGSLFFWFVKPVNAPDSIDLSVGNNVPGSCLSAKEKELLDLIQEFRAENNLTPVKISKSLTATAQLHAADSKQYYNSNSKDPKTGQFCNMHSWSNRGYWQSLCYTGDGRYAQGMWNKPREVTFNQFNGNGYEISAQGFNAMSQVINFWKQSNSHADVILERNIWNIFDWQSIGVGVSASNSPFSHVWFSDTSDSQGVLDCAVAGFVDQGNDSTRQTGENIKFNSYATKGQMRWSFGDGSTSTSANPSHKFLSPGKYEVILTVDYAGTKKVETKVYTVTGKDLGGGAKTPTPPTNPAPPPTPAAPPATPPSGDAPAAKAGPRPVYRFYNTATGTHFYTASESEKNKLLTNPSFASFQFEGVAFYAKDNSSNGKPVYRFYNAAAGTHFYTASESEKSKLLTEPNFAAFRYEGPNYYVPKANSTTTPLYRFYNTATGAHFYTKKTTERNKIIAEPNFASFQYEGEVYQVYP